MNNKNSNGELHLPETVKSGSKFFGNFIISKPIKQQLNVANKTLKKNQQLMIFTQFVKLRTLVELL